MDAKQRRQPLDAATLALIKIDIEESDLTLDEMSVKYDRSASYLSRLSREKGWLTRSERLGRRARSAPVLSIGLRRGDRATHIAWSSTRSSIRWRKAWKAVGSPRTT